MGYRWMFLILVGMATTSTATDIIAIEDALETVTVCSDHPTTDCQRITCMEICLKDTSTDPLECPSYCNLHAKRRNPANMGVAEFR